MATATLPPTTTTVPSLPISISQKSPARSPLNPSPAPSRSFLKKKTMSITQTYFLAHKARAKLSNEAGRPDHDLRLLVGHANLLDSLMLELADAEREQESWFNQSVSGAAKGDERHIRWADTAVEEPEDDWQAEDADFDSSSDSDSDLSDEDEDEDIDMIDVPLTRVASHPDLPLSPNTDYNDTEEDDDEEEDFAQLTLTRSPSHSGSPPELDHDSDSSEDEPMPPSPPTATVPAFAEKPKESIPTTDFYEPKQQEEQHSFYEDRFFLPRRNPARLISAISVY